MTYEKWRIAAESFGLSALVGSLSPVYRAVFDKFWRTAPTNFTRAVEELWRREPAGKVRL